ncbi:hypothetical protein BH09ACT5_BH09ACT5_00020 [soil metagenome]
MPARLSPRAAAAALAVIVLAGASAVTLAVLRGPVAGTTFATAHDHGTSAAGEAGAPAASPEQEARAEQLVVQTSAAIAQYADVAAAEASGYRWIGGESGEYRHYVRADYLLDDSELDPSRIESLVYRLRADGSEELVSGMYILRPGTTAAEAPDVGGALTPWHEHTNLCFDRTGSIAGTNDSGACPAGSVNVGTPPMLHVWVVENPDGPFAAVDENGIVTADHTHG